MSRGQHFQRGGSGELFRRSSRPSADRPTERKMDLSLRHPMVIWITGLSGAGKTTLCRALWQELKPSCPALVCLDGDAVRAAFGHDLGYREADRRTQIQRLQRLAQ